MMDSNFKGNMTAKPACILGEERTNTPIYCGLACKSDDQCGTAKCQNISGAGGKTASVCIYPNPGKLQPAVAVLHCVVLRAVW